MAVDCAVMNSRPAIETRGLEDDAKFRAALREGIGQADRGELIDDDEVRKGLEERERS
jgi:predicted transcriptional regulator